MNRHHTIFSTLVDIRISSIHRFLYFLLLLDSPLEDFAHGNLEENSVYTFFVFNICQELRHSGQLLGWIRNGFEKKESLNKKRIKLIFFRRSGTISDLSFRSILSSMRSDKSHFPIYFGNEKLFNMFKLVLTFEWSNGTECSHWMLPLLPQS